MTTNYRVSRTYPPFVTEGMSATEDYSPFVVEGMSATGGYLSVARDYSHLELPIRLEFYLHEKRAREQQAYAKKKRKNRAYTKMLNKHKKRGHKPKGSYVRSLNR